MNRDRERLYSAVAETMKRIAVDGYRGDSDYLLGRTLPELKAAIAEWEQAHPVGHRQKRWIRWDYRLRDQPIHCEKCAIKAGYVP